VAQVVAHPPMLVLGASPEWALAGATPAANESAAAISLVSGLGEGAAGALFVAWGNR